MKRLASFPLALLVCFAATLQPSWAESVQPPSFFLYANVLGYHPLAQKPLWVQQSTPPSKNASISFVPGVAAGQANSQGLKKDFAATLNDPSHTWGDLLPNGQVVLRPKTVAFHTLGNGAGLWQLNASKVKRAGQYQLRVSTALSEEASFDGLFKVNVSAKVFESLLAPALRTFYLQRSGVPVLDGQTGLRWNAGHTSPKALQGGWYEGPSYNQHTLATALASAWLMGLYEQDPKGLGRIKLGLPTGDDRPETALMPDSLKEAQVGLRWLMKLQQPNGGVASGLYRWPAVPAQTLPQEDTVPRQVLPPSRLSTWAAVAVWAQAAKVYEDMDPNFAVDCLLTAQRSYQALQQPQAKQWPLFSVPNKALGTVKGLAPSSPATTVPEAPATYQAPYWYSMPPEGTERHFKHWAMQQLQRISSRPLGQINPQQALQAPSVQEAPLEDWFNQPLFFGALQGDASAGLAQSTLLALAEQRKTEADTLLQPERWTEGEGAALWEQSNAHWVESGLLLLKAYQATQQAPWLETSATIFNALLGANPWRQPMVTGDAELTKLPLLGHPCNQLSRASGASIPGLLVLGGGPLQWEATPSKVLGPRLLPFADNSYACQSTATNLVLQAQWAYWLAGLQQAYNGLMPTKNTKLGAFTPRKQKPTAAIIVQPKL
jgi:endoglucanase